MNAITKTRSKWRYIYIVFCDWLDESCDGGDRRFIKKGKKKIITVLFLVFYYHFHFIIRMDVTLSIRRIVQKRMKWAFFFHFILLTKFSNR